MVAVVGYDLRAEFDRSVLSQDEQSRVRRFSSPEAARRWAAGRAGLRHILGAHAGIDPAELVLTRGTHGKPQLERSALQFNKSDCGELAVVAVCRGRAVGVDVEAHRVVSRAERIAERFFSDTERTEIAALPREHQLRAFFDCWTVKEAVLKCDGGGLGAIPMASFSSGLGQDWSGEIDGRWWGKRFTVGAGLSAAVVLEGPEAAPVEVRFTSPTEDAAAP